MTASPAKRVIAKFIDLFLVMAISAIPFYPVAPLLGFLYSLFADGTGFRSFDGQSIGKKLLKIRVVATADRRPIRWRRSLLRNIPVGVATFFALIPIWGWFILGIIGFPLMIIEIYLIVKAPRAQRLGDVMADTEVVGAVA